MPDVNEEAAPVVAEYDDSATVATLAEFKTEIERLNTVVDDLTPPVNPLAEFSGEEIFTALLVRRHGGEIANHALADVIGDLGAGDASGLAPDTYWGAGLQHKIDRRRPLFAVTGSAPFPDTGYNLDVPKVTQEVLVAKRGAEKTEANTRALQVENNPYPIVWFDGAVDVAREIISQSSPSVLSIIDDSFRNGWAVATEADATDVATVAATHTGAALDFTTYGALVADIITTSDLIEDATGLPGDRLAVTSAQWIGILSLMDGGDRRQFSMMNPSNADGSGSLLTRGIDVGGVFIFRAPAASVALQFNSDSLKTAEKSPMQLMAENVANIGVDVGVWGGTVTVTWAEGIYSYEIVS